MVGDNNYGRFPSFVYSTRQAHLARMQGLDTGDPAIQNFVREAEYRDQELEAWLAKCRCSDPTVKMYCFNDTSSVSHVSVAEGDETMPETGLDIPWNVTISPYSTCLLTVNWKRSIYWNESHDELCQIYDWPSFDIPEISDTGAFMYPNSMSTAGVVWMNPADSGHERLGHFSCSFHWEGELNIDLLGSTKVLNYPAITPSSYPYECSWGWYATLLTASAARQDTDTLPDCWWTEGDPGEG